MLMLWKSIFDILNIQMLPVVIQVKIISLVNISVRYSTSTIQNPVCDGPASLIRFHYVLMPHG